MRWHCKYLVGFLFLCLSNMVYLSNMAYKLINLTSSLGKFCCCEKVEEGSEHLGIMVRPIFNVELPSRCVLRRWERWLGIGWSLIICPFMKMSPIWTRLPKRWKRDILECSMDCFLFPQISSRKFMETLVFSFFFFFDKRDFCLGEITRCRVS